MKDIHILLVEDNEGDILLITEAFTEGKIINKMSVVRDGKEAIAFLNKTDGYAASELPDIILLDVNLPKKNGHEVLHYIKESESFKQIPVIMLSTSSSQTDIELSYKNQANCFITKPLEVDRFMEVLAGLGNFWVNIVTLPPKN